MNLVATNHLDTGMVNAEDVRTPQGRLLLKKGSPLTEQHLRIFKIWGISEVSIEGSEGKNNMEEQLEKVPLEFLTAAESLVPLFFGNTDMHHENMRELIRIFIQRTASEMSVEGMEPVLNRYRTRYNPPPHALRVETFPLSMDAVLNRKIRLASLPQTMQDLLDALDGQKSSASAIANIIGRDVSLSAKILQIVNSSFYGFPKRIDSLSRAVTILGGRQLQMVTMGISVMSVFKNIPDELLDMNSFWRHSISCGVLCKCMAEKFVVANEERLFLGGLLHDLGRLIMLQENPGAVNAAISIAREKGFPLHEVEKELWGFDHNQLGAEFLLAWNFPTALVDCVRYHHLPQKNNLDASIIHVADTIAHAAFLGCSGVWQLAPVASTAWETINFSKPSLEELIRMAEYQEKELISILA
jgi:putative nucleotidyltransferase with HDIG domain